MSKEIPIIFWKREGRCWIEPEEELEYELKYRISKKRKYPKNCILCYQPELIKLARKKYKARKTDALLGCDFYELKKNSKKIGIICSGIGAPMAVLILERLIARGVKNLLSIGIAGSLKYELKVGELVLCTKAMRCEGTSYFYLPPSKFAYPDEKLLKTVEKVLKEEKIPYHKGPSVTIDAPYRITIEECKRLRKEGIITSEGEASAIFAVSKFRGIRSAAIFVISDLATKDFKWKPQFHSKELEEGQKNLLKVAIKALVKANF